MINRTAKGKRKEKACADELKAQGYTQDKIFVRRGKKMVPAPLIWKTIRVQYQNIDMFGLFDVVALHPEGEHILFIQTKSNRCDGLTKDKIKALKVPPGCQKWIWIWKDRKYWEKIYLD